MTRADRIAALCTGDYTADQIADIVGDGATPQIVRNVAYNRRLSIRKISPEEHIRRTLAARTHGTGWTQERTDLLVKLWKEGASASQIAMRLGDVTRNAVLGKLNRMGVERPCGPPQIRSKSTIQKRKAQKPKPAPRPQQLTQVLARWALGPEPVAVDACKGVQCLKDQDCRWPIGDPRKPGFHFCGHERVPGASYCEHHLLRSVYPEYRAEIAKRYGLAPPPVAAGEGVDVSRELDEVGS
jgi:GcrA cell cycle regulator